MADDTSSLPHLPSIEKQVSKSDIQALREMDKSQDEIGGAVPSNEAPILQVLDSNYIDVKAVGRDNA